MLEAQRSCHLLPHNRIDYKSFIHIRKGCNINHQGTVLPYNTRKLPQNNRDFSKHNLIVVCPGQRMEIDFFNSSICIWINNCFAIAFHLNCFQVILKSVLEQIIIWGPLRTTRSITHNGSLLIRYGFWQQKSGYDRRPGHC